MRFTARKTVVRCGMLLATMLVVFACNDNEPAPPGQTSVDGGADALDMDAVAPNTGPFALAAQTLGDHLVPRDVLSMDLMPPPLQTTLLTENLPPPLLP